MPNLVDSESGQEIHLPQQDEIILGRSKQCDLVLNDNAVSRKHARIYRIGSQWFVEDLGSTNGVKVNGKKTDQHMLAEGDTLQLGGLRLIYRSGARPIFESASEHTIFADHARFSLPESTAAWRLPQSVGGKQTKGRRRVARYLPILEWLPAYKLSDLPGDLAAGATTAALLVPQGMAYALLAGLPPITGLYASMLPMLLYAVFGTCRQLSVAPVTLDSLLVAVIVGSLAQAGTPDYLESAVLLALMTGAVQLLLATARAGFLVNFLSSPVMCGFTSAAAIIIAISQLGNLLGFAFDRSQPVYAQVLDVARLLPESNYVALTVGLASIGLLLGTKRWKSFPAPLVAVAGGILATFLLGLADFGIKIVGHVPSGLPALELPSWSQERVVALLPGAVTLALIGFMQSISIGKVLAASGRYRIDPNQELRALGFANVAAGCSQGYSVTGGLSRSLVNARAGARAQLAAMVTAALIAATLVFLTPLFHYVPKPVLGAIVLVSVLGLVDVREMRRIMSVRREEGGLLAFTFVTTLAVGIQNGVLLGIAASILLFIIRNTRPNAALLGRLPNTDIYRNLEEFPDAEREPGIVILRIDASYCFANAEFIKNQLREIRSAMQESLRAVILDAAAINDLDSTADAALHEMLDDYEAQCVPIYIANVKGPVRRVMKRSGFYSRLGGSRFFFSIGAALERAKRDTAAGTARRE